MRKRTSRSIKYKDIRIRRRGRRWQVDYGMRNGRRIQRSFNSKVLAKGDTAAVVDSVKAAADVYAPVSGTVSAVNAALEGEPELVNTDPELGGWLFRLTLSDAGELAGLMNEAAYADYIKGL